MPHSNNHPENTKENIMLFNTMLSYDLTEGYAGPVLIGEYSPFIQLHEVMVEINDRSDFLHSYESFIDFSYDVKHASEGNLKIIHPSAGSKNEGVRYGVKMSWPVLLMEARMLRVALGYVDHSKWHQAVTWTLEAVIEDALRDDFKEEAENILRRLTGLNWMPSSKSDTIKDVFCMYDSWPPSKRKKELARLLCFGWANNLNEYKQVLRRGR
jgi:hypothetical protein